MLIVKYSPSSILHKIHPDLLRSIIVARIAMIHLVQPLAAMACRTAEQSEILSGAALQPCCHAPGSPCARISQHLMPICVLSSINAQLLGVFGMALLAQELIVLWALRQCIAAQRYAQCQGTRYYAFFSWILDHDVDHFSCTQLDAARGFFALTEENLYSTPAAYGWSVNYWL